jgi:hypothetical protein
VQKKSATISETYSRQSVALGRRASGPAPLVTSCRHDLTIQEVSSKPGCQCAVVTAKCDLCGETVKLADAIVQSRYFDAFRLKWPLAKE